MVDEEKPLQPVPDGVSRNLTYSLLERLGRAIVVGDFDDTAFPTEAVLASRYAVSRSVTREAVKMLTAKGLLTARPRKGTTVQPSGNWNLFDPDLLRWLLERKFSLALLRQFNELRVAIEPAAAALAARAADHSAIADIFAGFERMAAAEAGADNPLDADIAFHLQFQDVVATALRTSIHFTNRFKGRTASLPQHHDVLIAITAGDAGAATDAMRLLIEDVLALIAVAERTTEPSATQAAL